MGAHDRITSDSTVSRHESLEGVCQRSLSELDTPARTRRTSIQLIFVLVQEKPYDRLLYSSMQTSRPHAVIRRPTTTNEVQATSIAVGIGKRTIDR
jgi:hypothetical protein